MGGCKSSQGIGQYVGESAQRRSKFAGKVIELRGQLAVIFSLLHNFQYALSLQDRDRLQAGVN